MTYPHYIAWRTELHGLESFSDLISREKSKRLYKSLNLIENSTYRILTEIVDDKFLREFVPLYTKNIQTKKHGNVFDVKTAIERNLQRGIIYESISLRHNHNLLGALIYSLRKKSLSVAYRIFPHHLILKLPLSSSYIGEHYLVKQALSHQRRFITHGRDRNLYGPNSSIGVAEFKLSVGSRPYVSSAATNNFYPVSLLQAHEDTLMFLGSRPKEAITHGILFIPERTNSTLEKYASLLKQNIVSITTQS